MAGAEPVRVVAAVVVDAPESPASLLVARRVRPERLRGLWELPGGKVEPGESDVEALHRELREELGITVDILAPIDGPEGPEWCGERPGVRIRLFLTERVDGVPCPLDGHDRVMWVTRPGWASACEWMPGNAAMAAAGEAAAAARRPLNGCAEPR